MPDTEKPNQAGPFPATERAEQEPEELALEGKLALVVDDDPDLCEFVRQVLTKAGCRVTSAQDGAAALAAIAREIPDVVLLDIKMPRISGDEVLDVLARIERHPPVIVMTAAKRARDRALRHRNPYYLPKPFDPALLIATVETALEPTG
ncbi:MAG: response regulator [Deltaproteobacteria bacterium]|nr:response regulator [Deltaproteobacteria bacterium]